MVPCWPPPPPQKYELIHLAKKPNKIFWYDHLPKKNFQQYHRTPKPERYKRCSVSKQIPGQNRGAQVKKIQRKNWSHRPLALTQSTQSTRVFWGGGGEGGALHSARPVTFLYSRRCAPPPLWFYRSGVWARAPQGNPEPYRNRFEKIKIWQRCQNSHVTTTRVARGAFWKKLHPISGKTRCRFLFF